MAIETEIDAIASTLELSGTWPVTEWTDIEISEAQTLTDSLYPRLIKILNGDQQEFEGLIHPGAFWRDLVCLTWTFRTFQSKE